MSAVVHRDRYGVLLRYEIDAPLRLQRKEQPSDRERIAIVAAEREIRALETIADALDLSPAGLTRINDALFTIRRALELKRPVLGLAKSADTV